MTEPPDYTTGDASPPTDTTTMTGAQFRRHAGTSAAKWAEALVAAYDREGLHVAPVAERAFYVEGWLRDYAEARVAEEVGRVTAAVATAGRPPEPPHDA